MQPLEPLAAVYVDVARFTAATLALQSDHPLAAAVDAFMTGSASVEVSSAASWSVCCGSGDGGCGSEPDPERRG